MVVVGLLLGFASVVVLLGGNNADVSQLYYDADFAELYKVEESEDSSRKFKGGRPIEQVETAEPEAAISLQQPEQEVIPVPPAVSLQKPSVSDTPPSGDTDMSDEMLAAEIFDGLDL